MPEEDLLFNYYSEAAIKNVIPESLEIKEMDRYTEEAPDDSLVVILKKSIK